MPIAIRSIAHVRLTVTDIDRSRAFYDAIFGFPIAIEMPADANAATRDKFAFLYGGVIYAVGNSALGLRPVGSDSFDEDRVGLDHLSFAVAGKADLDAAVRILDEHRVNHCGVKEILDGWILEFRDPDNIALELYAPRG